MPVAQDKKRKKINSNMFVCMFCLLLLIPPGLLDSGWLMAVGKCIVNSMVCFNNVILCCLLVWYILPSPGLLGSGWLSCLSLSGSPGLHTLNYCSIVCLLQVLYAYSVHP